MSPLARQIVRSMRQHPERWERSGRYMQRDDGVQLQVHRQIESRTFARMRLCSPREVEFSQIDGWIMRRTIRWWQHRVI